MSRSTKVALIMAPVAVTVGVVAVLVGISKDEGSGRYGSPDEAVTATCHATHVLGDYAVHGGRYRIGWQPRGASPGTGWTAIVEHHSGGFEVIDCKFQGITHA